MTQFNRRDFLRTVGATSGAGAMFATMEALGLAPTAQAATREPAYAAPRKHQEAAWRDTPGGPDDTRYRPLNEPPGRVYFSPTTG